MGLTKQGLERLWAHITNKFNTLIGDKPVSEQIEEAVEGISPADIGAQPAGDYALKTEILPSDWNENDANSPAYVKNRTHYADSGNVDCTANLGIVEGPRWQMYRKVSELAPTFAILDAGVTNVVYIADDMPIEGEPFIWSQMTAVTASSGSGSGSTTNTSIRYTGGGPSQFSSDVMIIYDDVFLGPGMYVKEGSTLYSLSWSGVQQLDEKYIPDTIARAADISQPDWNQSDETASNYVKNRTHYSSFETISCTAETYGRYENWTKISNIFPNLIQPYDSTTKLTWTISGQVQEFNIRWRNNGTWQYDCFIGEINDGYDYIEAIMLVNVQEGYEYGLGTGIYVRPIGIQDFSWEVITELPEKYIPSTIARVEDVPPRLNLVNSPNGGVTSIDSVGRQEPFTSRNSLAMGVDNVASGHVSAAFGRISIASGDNSFAQGDCAEAHGYGSQAMGMFVIAKGNNQFVQGKYNVEDPSNVYAHIVGNGAYDENTSWERVNSNAYALDWNGNAYYAGDVYVTGDGKNDFAGAKKLATEDYVNAQIQAAVANLLTREQMVEYVETSILGGEW